MRKQAILTAMLLVLAASVPAWARGGGGCLARGTPIPTPAGATAIETLRVGDPVWGVAGGKLQAGTVQALTETGTDRYLEILAGDSRILITPEHPVMAGPGEYRIARLLKVGDRIYRMRHGNLDAVPIRSIQPVRADQPAYHLLVMPGGTFIPAGIVVHNKGCFLPESLILQPDGAEKPISAVRPGDPVLAYSPEGRIVQTTVRNILRLTVDEYVILKTERQTIRATAEHPFYVGRGTFKTLDILKAGDVIFAREGQSLSEQRIVSIRTVHERVPVFNLQTDHPNTFFAGGVAVHNKGGGGGCFPAGTMIRTPSGQTPVEKLSAGDRVQAVNPERGMVEAGVEKLFATRSAVMTIETDRGTLRTTSEHPVGLPGGLFLEAGKLRPGQKVLILNDGVLNPAAVIGTSTQEREEVVYNLSVGSPHTFLAGDFLVHNKGGGGGSSHSSSSHSSSSGSGSGSGSFADFFWNLFFFILFIIILLVVLCLLSYALKAVLPQKAKDENLDYLYPPAMVAKKAVKTEKLVEFLSKQDPSFALPELRRLAESTFRKLQECWGKREYGPMEPLLMRALFLQHCVQLQGLVRNHEINRIDDLKVEKVDIVNLRYTERSDQREFSALMTASARDYYVDDRNQKYLRGDESPARFQEFWTFQRSGDRWLLREIEQSGESDLLKEENFVEMLTDQTLQGIYGAVAGKEGKAGPWLEKGTEEKATRIDRMLNFLVRTDKLWNRQQMIERARQVFLSVFLARETGDPAQAPEADLFRNVADNLRKQILQWQMDGMHVEYRNLCVRKAELILIRNYADPARDEFTVRISAHAQKIVRKGRQSLSEQQYVTPFEEYWTFGRLDGAWKLKEVLPPARGEKLIAEENVDEESGAGQMQWYYRQTRAN
ncbi:MAG: polymorphic toxin-type HINT domain-containing protein [Deltaproteobacteria bacterium]|nr:polymorphic toxin-type HINT domain-containing protein [Deltaproteobacteria bacterium]